jgi:hypothetical protein
VRSTSDEVPPEQIVWVKELLVTDILGLTVIVQTIGIPVQPFAVGVIVYVSV